MTRECIIILASKINRKLYHGMKLVMLKPNHYIILQINYVWKALVPQEQYTCRKLLLMNCHWLFDLKTNYSSLLWYIAHSTRATRERTRETTTGGSSETAGRGSKTDTGSQRSRSKMAGWTGTQATGIKRERVIEKYWPRQWE